MKYKIALIPGDGIGPEIVAEARKVLDRVGTVYGHEFLYEELLMGGASIDATGEPLTAETLQKAKEHYIPVFFSFLQSQKPILQFDKFHFHHMALCQLLCVFLFLFLFFVLRNTLHLSILLLQ